MNKLKDLIAAASFAAQKHVGQRRKGNDAAPYINHPLEVANLLANVGGIEDFDILIAAILHDTVEDTETTKKEITDKFGERVAAMVMEVTDDKTLPKDKRKDLQIEHAPKLSDGAKQIKLGDKISNIRDILDNPPAGWSVDRRREYVEWGKNVVKGLRGANQSLENHFDELVKRAENEL